ncbi:hypothetical protein EMIT047CA2_160028 [Pseudomonas soli]
MAGPRPWNYSVDQIESLDSRGLARIWQIWQVPCGACVTGCSSAVPRLALRSNCPVSGLD